ncbi:uncharacterized protein LOC112349158 [Selaginella moellendorffii]|uniref:uncharacterized protein LOC112349158 n=1 Tax=Selaginella moellendorffii TaxID=88036 RepID=UPI000D1C88F3|nr:uncharacterized protein LOC112349158 [Selaginella moellendorffii]|eukprot:XP_024538768.1 uncharacterized protein LOC112349158 [Selaginella moellendorffii]
MMESEQAVVESMGTGPMDSMSPVDMLKLLEDEAERLCQIEQKILNQLHHLQVEESIYTQAMKQLETANTTSEQPKEALDEADEDDDDDMNFAEELDRELAEALKATLQADDLLRKDDTGTAAPEDKASQDSE